MADRTTCTREDAMKRTIRILASLTLSSLVATAFALAYPAEHEHAAAKPPPSPASAGVGAPNAKAIGAGAWSLPDYHEPEAYSVDLVIQSPNASMVLKRFIDRGRIRTEMTGAGENIVMIEMRNEKGTTLTLMPREKRAIKQSREATQSMVAERPGKKIEDAGAKETDAPAPEVKVEDLGEETIDGKAARKLRLSVPEGSSVGWFDKATGAPLRMEGTVDGQPASIEWKNLKIGPQPAKLFEVPRDYELTDMDQLMSQMKGMGGAGGMGALGGLMGGTGGRLGAAGGMKGMMGGAGQSMGQNLGEGFGASLGGAMGGPMGAIAGRYLGGKVGGAIGKRAGETLAPGK